MIILPEYGHAFTIDDVSSVVIPKYAWFYDMQLNDFLLRPIHMLEETTGPTVTARVNGTIINVPASWYMLIVDDETKTVDTVPIDRCSSFKAYLMHPRLNRYEAIDVELLDIDYNGSVVHLTIPRLTMICHPVGSTVNSRDLPMCVLIGPQDIGKHMGSMSAQELLL